MSEEELRIRIDELLQAYVQFLTLGEATTAFVNLFNEVERENSLKRESA